MKFWDDRKSIQLTKWCVVLIALLGAAATVCGPRIVTWIVHERPLNLNGPAVGALLLGIGYCCAATLFVMLFQLYRFLRALEAGQVFVSQNVTYLRRISWCCAVATAFCVFTGTVLYTPYLVLGLATGFMALLVRVLKNAFEQAVKMKDELDFTV